MSLNIVAGFPDGGTVWGIANGQVGWVGAWNVTFAVGAGKTIAGLRTTALDNGANNGHPGADSSSVISMLVLTNAAVPGFTVLCQSITDSSGTVQTLYADADYLTKPGDVVKARFVTFAPYGVPSNFSTLMEAEVL